MYDYISHPDFISAIYSAPDARTFCSAVNNYLNNAIMQWWSSLQDKTRQAIILLDFEPSVVTTMAFFSHGWGFNGDYTNVMRAIIEKADSLAKENPSSLESWDCELRPVINSARLQMEREEEVRHAAVEIARNLNMEISIEALGDFLVNKSGLVIADKKRKEEYAKEMRKAFLHDALSYLRKNYKNEKKGK